METLIHEKRENLGPLMHKNIIAKIQFTLCLAKISYCENFCVYSKLLIGCQYVHPIKYTVVRQCQKYFVDSTEPRKFFSWKFLSHELIYETNISFLHEAMMLPGHVLQTCFRMIAIYISFNNSAWCMIANYMLLQVVVHKLVSHSQVGSHNC